MLTKQKQKIIVYLFPFPYSFFRTTWWTRWNCYPTWTHRRISTHRPPADLATMPTVTIFWQHCSTRVTAAQRRCQQSDDSDDKTQLQAEMWWVFVLVLFFRLTAAHAVFGRFVGENGNCFNPTAWRKGLLFKQNVWNVISNVALT